MKMWESIQQNKSKNEIIWESIRVKASNMMRTNEVHYLKCKLPGFLFLWGERSMRVIFSEGKHM
jgi:hypothetical protein